MNRLGFLVGSWQKDNERNKRPELAQPTNHRQLQNDQFVRTTAAPNPRQIKPTLSLSRLNRSASAFCGQRRDSTISRLLSGIEIRPMLLRSKRIHSEFMHCFNWPELRRRTEDQHLTTKRKWFIDKRKSLSISSTNFMQNCFQRAP